MTSVFFPWTMISGIFVWNIYKRLPLQDFSLSLYMKVSSYINLQTRAQADCLENTLTQFLLNS